jgi:BirA family biotin operon repressor/biotin-[acetyl-CoA-carboxylase] ligase
MNVSMPQSAGNEIDQQWTDLEKVLYTRVPSRNVLAARLLDAVVPAIHSFEHGHMKNLRQAWRRYDFIYGQVVELQTERGRHCGKAAGIDEQGRLLVEVDGRQHAFSCGEVSLSFPRAHSSGAQAEDGVL